MIYANSVSVSPSHITLQKGKWYYDLCAIVSPSNATYKSVEWCSSNEDIVAVNESTGYIYARSVGTVTICATACDGSEARGYCIVTVKESVPVTDNVLVTSITIDKQSLTLGVGASEFLHETVCPPNATKKSVEWSSSNKSVATVNPSTGLVYAVSTGTAVIYATACDDSGVRGICQVTVVPPVSVTGITVCPTSKTIKVGEKAQLFATVSPGNATNKKVRWVSHNTHVAYVDPYTGCVSAFHKGIATITATTDDGSFKASCEVTVPPEDVVNIVKDDYSFYIQFNNGFRWNYIGYDIKDTMYSPQPISYRAYDNRQIPFTIKQLAFLYLFDPIGVEHYVRNYDYPEYDDIVDILIFKDKLYEEIFGVSPRYFRIYVDGDILYFKHVGNDFRNFRKHHYSDAEILFGSHHIVDSLSLAGFVVRALETIFENIPIVSDIVDCVELYQAMFYRGAIQEALSSSVTTFINEYVEYSLTSPVYDISSGNLVDPPYSKSLGCFSWVMGLLLGLTVDAMESFLPTNLNDIEIYQKVVNQDFSTHFLIESSDIPIENILASCTNQ